MRHLILILGLLLKLSSAETKEDILQPLSAEKTDTQQANSTNHVTEFDSVLIQKDDLMLRLQEMKQQLEAKKAEGDEDATSSEKVVELRINQLRTLENLFSSSFEAMKFIVGLNSTQLDTQNEDLTKIFEDIRKQNMKIVAESLDAAFKAQTEYQQTVQQEEKLSKAEEQKKKATQAEGDSGNVAKEIVGDVLQNLEGAVNELEQSMHNKDKAIEEEKKKGTLEAVVKIDDNVVKDEKPEVKDKEPGEDHKHAHAHDGSSNKHTNDTSRPPSLPSSIDMIAKPISVKTKPVLQAPKLIDAEQNIYIMTRSNDPTKHMEDIAFFFDIIYILCGSFLGGYIFDRLRLPPFFGYLMAGTILGPTYFDRIKRLIQIETLGTFGILLILFVLGLEFPLEQIKKFWRVTVIGGSSMVALSILVSIIGGSIAGFALNQCIFFGCVVSLSSTTVVAKCLKDEHETRHARIMLSILVQQDVMLGLFLAGIPALAQTGSTVGDSIATMAVVVLKNVLFMILALLFGKLVMPFLIKLVKMVVNEELHVLGVLSICMLFIVIAEQVEISIEVASFMAGVVIGGKALASEKYQLMEQIEAVRDFFSCLFFAAIGFHIYPSFLFKQAPLLLLVTIALMTIKTIIAVLVLHFGLKFPQWQTIIIGIGLSQISEFAFVLCSRAKTMQIISKEAYYLTIGATSLSLLFTPFLWKLFGKSAGSRRSSPSRSNFDSDNEPIIPLASIPHSLEDILAPPHARSTTTQNSHVYRIRNPDSSVSVATHYSEDKQLRLPVAAC